MMLLKGWMEYDWVGLQYIIDRNMVLKRGFRDILYSGPRSSYDHGVYRRMSVSFAFIHIPRSYRQAAIPRGKQPLTDLLGAMIVWYSSEHVGLCVCVSL